MRTGALAFLGVMLLATPALAMAVIDKSQAAGEARTDPGTGLCGTASHFKQGDPIVEQSSAEAMMNKPSTDADILGRTARLFDNINFRNGQVNTKGDLTPPGSDEDVFLPYSSDPAAMPMGTDGNITLRLRGYFNVPATLAGKTISFALNCDDFCFLRIGTTLVATGNEWVSARVIKQATFADAGLYPVELTYVQNGSTAYLEWARTDSAVPECPNDVCAYQLTDPMYAGKFKLIRKAELYSAKTGVNLGCQECGAPGLSCSSGNYCGNGLCATCSESDHCGPSCMKCPANARLCRSGGCIQCVSDDQCPDAQACDVPSGTCLSPHPCSVSTQCPQAQVCSLETSFCANPPTPCTSDAMCLPGQVCVTTSGVCRSKPQLCNAESDCVSGFHCDLAAHLCARSATLPRLQVTGCTAAAGAAPQAARSRAGLALLLLGFGAAAYIGFRRAHRHAQDARRM